VIVLRAATPDSVSVPATDLMKRWTVASVPELVSVPALVATVFRVMAPELDSVPESARKVFRASAPDDDSVPVTALMKR